MRVKVFTVIIFLLAFFISFIFASRNSYVFAGSLYIMPGKTTMAQIINAFGQPKQGITEYQNKHKVLTYQQTNNKYLLIFFKYPLFSSLVNKNGKEIYTLNPNNVVTYTMTARRK